MSEVTIAIQDYKIIRQAKLKLKPGISMIVAQNRSGKSTVIKALKTLVDGTYGESNLPRHGTDGYAIAVKIDDSKVRVARRGTQTFLKYGDESEVSKLGRGALSKLEPRFPLKRVDYLDNSFYPNFSFQNDIPLFNDISVFDLFSSMFSDVARVAQRVDALRKDTVNLGRAVQDLEANVAYQTDETGKAESAWKAFQEKNPTLDADYERASAANKLDGTLKTLEATMNQYKSQLPENIEQLVVEYETAKPLFEVYDRVQALKPIYEELLRKRQDLATLSEPAVFDSELIRQGYQVSSLIKEYNLVEAKLKTIPDTTFIQEVFNLKRNQEELAKVTLDYNDIVKEHDELLEQVKKEGCPYMIAGVCPKL